MKTLQVPYKAFTGWIVAAFIDGTRRVGKPRCNDAALITTCNVSSYTVDDAICRHMVDDSLAVLVGF